LEVIKINQHYQNKINQYYQNKINQHYQNKINQYYQNQPTLSKSTNIIKVNFNFREKLKRVRDDP